MIEAKNVLGGKLQPCCKFPMTGFYRDGSCNTGPEDEGRHVVCIRLTDEFLAFSFKAGNDLSTPMPEFDFPGLIAGDQWCLCALRWQEALEAGAAPEVILESTHASALEVLKLEDLKKHAVPENQTF
jgi:uncharacterized protein (DUF2237 family)